MAGMKLKNGADLCGFELRRFTIQNDSSDPTDLKVGRKYFNNGGGTAHLRERIYVGDKTITTDGWRDAAYMDDIKRLEGIIGSLDGNVGDNLLGLAEQLNAVQAKVDAFLEGDVDADAVLENLNELKQFLDTYSGDVTLSQVLNDINEEVAKKADKATTLAGYGITDAVAYASRIMGETAYASLGYGYQENGWRNTGPAIVFGVNSQYRHLIQGTSNPDASLWHKAYTQNLADGASAWYKILDENNYASVLGTVYAPYNAAGYLPLSGGTISSALTIQSGDDGKLILDNTDTETYWSLIYFKQNGETYGRFGTQGTTDLSWNSNLILHSGNFNSCAPTLTGTGASGTWGIDITGAATALKPTLTRPSTANVEPIGDGSVRSFLVTSLMTEGNPHDDAAGTILSFYWDTVAKYTRQLFIGAEDAIDSPNKRLAWRTQDGHRWSDWKTVAFTDSNVASATKLQTARSLWGNSFDGTADINGDIHLAADKGIVASNGYAVLTAPSYLLLGYAQSELGQTTYLDGNDIYLRYGKNHVPAMYINSSGNVTIGASDLASVNHRLYVSGDTHIDGMLSTYYSFKFLRESENYIAIPASGSLSFKVGDTVSAVLNSNGNVTIGGSDKAGGTYRLLIDEATHVQKVVDHGTLGSPSKSFSIGSKQYGLDVWVKNDGSSNIQSHRFDGTATAYALNLQPLGGDVVLGSANSVTSVNGNLSVTKSATFKENAFFSGSEGIYINASGINWGKQFSIVSNLIGFASNQITMYPKVVIGTQVSNNALMLDVSGTIRAAKSIISYAKDGYSQVELLYGDNTGWVLSQRGAETSKDFGIYSLVNGVDTCRFRIKEDGSVGIGVINPYQKLHVAGNILLRNFDSIRFFKSDGTTQVESLTLNSDNEVVLGGDANYYSLNTIVKGYRTIIKAGTYNTSALIIDENCNAAFSSRLTVNGATDNGSTGLQVIGGAHIQGDIANHLSNILTSGVGTWAKGHFAVNSSGARLGGFGFLVGENSYLNYLFLGLYGNEWLKINAYESIFGVSTKFNAGALIPTGQTLKIGDATLSWDSVNNALKVDKSFYSTEEVSAGGIGSGTTSGGGGGTNNTKAFDIPIGTESMTFAHNLGTKDVIVAIYEISDSYQQVLADVIINNISEVTIMFGEATEVAHRVVIMG